ncbi:DUF397 domain-containing protein [Streptomyces sp. NPDC015346]|uniref:DUF397 domain-containing protein n=1 Tax=Streptomyces sp. NPDC015346 TaxID=3364954 RepID=UPI0036F83E7F
MPSFMFKKSSYSSGDAHGECVEVALNIPGTAAVRDSKDAHRATLVLSSAAWASFLTALEDEGPGV